MFSLLRTTSHAKTRFVGNVRDRCRECWSARSFKRAVEQTEPLLTERPNAKSLLKPFAFTVGFSGTAVTVCIVWHFESSVAFRQKLNHWIDWKQNLHSLEDNQRQRNTRGLTNELMEWWNSRNQAFKLFAAIAALNGLVFIGWKIPRLNHFMTKYFMTHTHTKPLRCWPMVLSTFSHYSATHLIFNLVVLHSFSQIGVQLFGIEQFLALYLSSGVVSSMASYMAKVVTARASSSLGASGAILGVLSSCCVARPDLELVIIFLPFFTISAGMALKGIIMLDTAGLLFGWRFFDHSAHLGGALYGMYAFPPVPVSFDKTFSPYV